MIIYLLNKIRPNKSFSNELDRWGLTLYISRYFVDLLRSSYHKLLGVKCDICFFGKKVKVDFPKSVSLGKHSSIGDYSILSGLGRSGLIIGERTSIGAFCRIVVSTNLENPGEYIRIGKNVGIAEYSSIGGSGGVIIGDDTIIAQYFSAHPENHNCDDVNKPIREQGTKRKGISIGSGCWIGAKVSVLSGVTIGDGAVIGAGSIVNKDIPSNAIAVGVPARVIKFRGEE